MASHDDGWTVTAKVAIAWLGTMFGSVTLSDLVLSLTAIYTILNSYFLIRDKWWRDSK